MSTWRKITCGALSACGAGFVSCTGWYFSAPPEGEFSTKELGGASTPWCMRDFTIKSF